MRKKNSPKHLKQAVPKEPVKPIRFGVYFIIIFVVAAAAVVLISWDRFTVREIEIEGIQKINYLEVIHLSGIEYMSNIFAVNLKDVESNIEQNPVLDVLNTKRMLPDTIIITVVERSPIAAIKAEDKYIVVDKDLVALSVQEASSAPENSKIEGATVSSYQLGKEVALTKAIHVKKLKTLLEALQTTGVANLIETINISFTENIKLLSKSEYEIQIGSVDNIENKCLWIKTMIPKLLDEGKQGGTLYITNVNTAHYIAPNEE